MQIVVAPDKFKGSLSAERAAQALTRGARRVHPEAAFHVRPIADGGEGTVSAFVTALGGRVRDIRVTGPFGDLMTAPIGLLENGRAIVEMASASGLVLVTDPSPAVRASSRGTGELVREALRIPDVRTIIVGVGGSASTDGGTGAASAIGWRFLDDRGEELGPGGGELVGLAHIEPPTGGAPRIEVVAACDVDNPLIGERGAAAIFGPQKGASPEEVVILARGLERLAEVISRDLGRDVSTIPSGGAGGGMGAGLVAFFGAELRSGFDLLAETTGLEDEIRAADLVITGEGRFDDQSRGGKAPVAVARLAAQHHTPCVVVAGDLAMERSEWRKLGIELAVGLAQTGGAERGETDPEGAVEVAIAGLLRHRLEKKQGSSFSRRRRP